MKGGHRKQSDRPIIWCKQVTINHRHRDARFAPSFALVLPELKSCIVILNVCQIFPPTHPIFPQIGFENWKHNSITSQIKTNVTKCIFIKSHFLNQIFCKSGRKMPQIFVKSNQEIQLLNISCMETIEQDAQKGYLGKPIRKEDCVNYKILTTILLLELSHLNLSILVGEGLWHRHDNYGE